MIGPHGLNVHGTIFASNPPAGLTALNGNGSTDNAAALNGIFASLPHPNTNTRTVWFSRPATAYKINSPVTIGVAGTRTFADGTIYYEITNSDSFAQSMVTGSERPYFLGNGANTSPIFRVNADHVVLTSIGCRHRTSQAGGSAAQVAVEITGSFCALVRAYLRFGEAVAQIYAPSGFVDCSLTETIEIIDTNTGPTGCPIGRTDIPGRVNNGTVRGGGLWNPYLKALLSGGNRFDRAQDIVIYGGTSEFNAGDRGYTVQPNAKRISNIGSMMENDPEAFWVESGGSGLAIGFPSWAQGPGDSYDWNNIP